MVDENAISRVYKEQEGFQSQLFVVRKKDGGHRPIINLKKLNSFVQNRALQDEGHSYAQGPPKARGLDDQSQPERR